MWGVACFVVMDAVTLKDAAVSKGVTFFGVTPLNLLTFEFDAATGDKGPFCKRFSNKVRNPWGRRLVRREGRGSFVRRLG